MDLQTPTSFLKNRERSTVCILGALDLQRVFVKIKDFIKFNGLLVEFLENRRSWENQKPPENHQKSGLFWASPFTMRLVYTQLKQESQTPETLEEQNANQGFFMKIWEEDQVSDTKSQSRMFVEQTRRFVNYSSSFKRSENIGYHRQQLVTVHKFFWANELKIAVAVLAAPRSN